LGDGWGGGYLESKISNRKSQNHLPADAKASAFAGGQLKSKNYLKDLRFKMQI